MAAYFAHPTATIDDGCTIGDGTKIWHYSHVSPGAVLGKGCNLGQNVFIANNVKLGEGVKVQNNVSLYTGVELGDYVFCGPSCVFTNVTNPRSELNRKSEYKKTFVGRGATIGANATIICGGSIGRYALIAAGATVLRSDVPDYALMLGVPAKQRGWVSRHGHILKSPDAEGVYTCPETGWRYKEVEPGRLKCLDWDEDKPLA